jgi:PleD family two-component response regulator
MTNLITHTDGAFPADGDAAKKVVIVNGSPETLQMFEMVLDAGHYDVVFVESNEHAYSQIKRVLPNLVILCVNIDEMQGFQVLSMLKLDDATRGIPVLTCTTDDTDMPEDDEREDEDSDVRSMEMLAKTAHYMN